MLIIVRSSPHVAVLLFWCDNTMWNLLSLSILIFCLLNAEKMTHINVNSSALPDVVSSGERLIHS